MVVRSRLTDSSTYLCQICTHISECLFSACSLFVTHFGHFDSSVQVSFSVLLRVFRLESNV